MTATHHLGSRAGPAAGQRCVRRLATPMAMLAVAWLLAACGGGDVGGADSLNAVPQAALESPQAFSAYVASLAPDDRAEPIAIDGLMPPASDTDEPIER